MNTQNIQSLIEYIKQNHSEEEAYIGFFYEEDYGDTSFIKANREGLRLYASNLLEASISKNNELFKIDDSICLGHSDFSFRHIEI